VEEEVFRLEYVAVFISDRFKNSILFEPAKVSILRTSIIVDKRFYDWTFYAECISILNGLD